MRRIIVGAGSLGRELFEWGCEGPSTSPPVVFLDDEPRRASTRVRVPVFAIHGFVPEHGDYMLVAIADPEARRAMVERLALAGQVSLLRGWRHRTSILANTCEHGYGTLLLPYSLVSSDAVLGAHCILNTHATVGHDVKMGGFCTLSSHVDICGRVTVGDRVFFGSGARVLPDLTVGNDAVIGAGAVVVQDVPAGATVFGVPARRVK